MLALLLLSIVPQPAPVVRERLDSAHLNHFYNEHGRLVFDQLIFEDWNDSDCCEEVVAWRLVKDVLQIPARDFEIGGYVVRWCDKDTEREVRFMFFRESWTQTDVELVARERLPKEARRELRKPSP